MKLTKEEPAMLPAWVVSGVCTESFFEWLTEADESSVWEYHTYAVVKVKQGNFFYLYFQQREGKSLVPGNDLKFLGIFSRKNYGLYDVGLKLIELLCLPKEMRFPDREDVRREAEECVSQKAYQTLNLYWQDFLCQSGYAAKQLIPLVDRSEIRECAEKYYLQDEDPDTIQFVPKISLEASFSNTSYLLFLEYGEQMAEKIARQWIRQNIPYISQQRIFYGCVRDEYKDILNTPNDRIHKIKRLIRALGENESRMAQVDLCCRKKVIHTKMLTAELCNPKGRYSIRKLPKKDRTVLEHVFGKAAEFRIEDIHSVSCGGKLLYETAVKKKTA